MTALECFAWLSGRQHILTEDSRDIRQTSCAAAQANWLGSSSY